MEEIKFLQISSLEKVFLKKEPECEELMSLTAMRNERVSYQIAYFKKNRIKSAVKINIASKLEKYVTVRQVENVPVQLPMYEESCDEDYIMDGPGLAPDVLVPIDLSDTKLRGGSWYSFWISVDLTSGVPAGKYDIDISFSFDDTSVKKTMSLEVIDAFLPKQSLIYTNWLHTDCIASYFEVEMFSEKHWEHIEKFISTAAKNGVNMILTPIFTPPLDTPVGDERPTAQLVDISIKDGKYSFGFERLTRWINMCRGLGIEYFEMAHLFTQWGAKFTPKIVADIDGKTTRIFGWDVTATSDKYREFLDSFLPALTSYLRDMGIVEKTFFHISDEPYGDEAKKNYIAALELVKRHLKGFKIIDALSDVEFYNEGIIELPIPANDHIRKFIDAGVPELWTYYCCTQGKGVSNRFIAMPSYRNRVIADQMFKYNVRGFLHWGYNFYYYSNYSNLFRELVNPFWVTDGMSTYPAGDAFSVYPYAGGAAESLRLVVFSEALADMRAMALLESFIGHDEVVALLEDTAKMKIEFDSYPKNAEYILRRRELINRKIAELV